jgi:hypothetical protein
MLGHPRRTVNRTRWHGCEKKGRVFVRLRRQLVRPLAQSVRVCWRMITARDLTPRQWRESLTATEPQRTLAVRRFSNTQAGSEPFARFSTPLFNGLQISRFDPFCSDTTRSDRATITISLPCGGIPQLKILDEVVGNSEVMAELGLRTSLAGITTPVTCRRGV